MVKNEPPPVVRRVSSYDIFQRYFVPEDAASNRGESLLDVYESRKDPAPIVASPAICACPRAFNDSMQGHESSVDLPATLKPLSLKRS